LLYDIAVIKDHSVRETTGVNTSHVSTTLYSNPFYVQLVQEDIFLFFIYGLKLKNKELRFFDSPGIMTPKTQHKIPEDMNLQQHRCENFLPRRFLRPVQSILTSDC